VSTTSYVTISSFLLHDNAPVNRSLLTMDFSAKNNVKTPEHPSTDLAPADFCLFPPPKQAQKGRRFCDATDFIKNATKELKRLSQNGCQEVSNTFTVAGRISHGHYFEGNEA